ncbi:MAG TPA: arginase [Planctomycetota bacterium]|nr:arginase [Planctomycetota bacterium]
MKSKRIDILGVPMDLGTHLRGVDMGPSAIRIAGLNEKLRSMGLRVCDLGNLSVPHAHVAKISRAEAKRLSKPEAGAEHELPFAPPVARVCRELMHKVEESLNHGNVPLVLGGDHSIAIGTLSGLARYARRKRANYGLLWVDAHGDCNTPGTSPSGNIHGMPLAAALGHGPELFTNMAGICPMVDPKRTVLLGIRDLDSGERANIKKFGVHVYTMREIDERGVNVCMREALSIVKGGTAGFHLSFDIDSLDPSVAPGVGTPVSGGLTIREAHLIMELVADSKAMISCELVEVNPALDQRNTTAWLASELLMSALGASIL